MGRPALPLGTYGKIRVYPDGGNFRARTLYRDWDGVTRAVEKTGRTKSAATRALSEALRDRARPDASAAITPDTRLSVVAEKWFAELDLRPSTMQLYRDRLDRQVLPALGQVKIRELTVGLLDRHLASVRKTHGAALAKTTRSVLSGICALATRHDALPTNPVRDVGNIPVAPKHAKAALTAADIRSIRTWLAGDQRANDRDLPDLVSFLAATGARIGEALAATWNHVDLDPDAETGTFTVTGTVVRIKGQGLQIQPAPKTRAGARRLQLPSWCVRLLHDRHATQHANDAERGPMPELVFPAPLSGALRDPSNTRRGLRDAFRDMGIDGLTSHAFRRAVATIMDDAGLTARQAADQLGHARPSITQDIYMNRTTQPTGAAALLEQLNTA